MTDFQTVLVRDSTINDITPDLAFGVKTGAANTTYQQFTANTSSNSSMVFTVQVPSQDIIMGRDIMIRTGITFTALVTGVPAGQPAMNYGLTEALQAFPFNSLITTANAQINNTTATVNLQDIFPQILKMNNTRELLRYNSGTPAFPDSGYGVFADGYQATNNVLASFNNASYDVDQQGRGAYPVSIFSQRTSTLAANPGVSATLVSSDPTDTFIITIQTIVTEPLFLSPFTWGDPEYNSQGFLGLNNFTLTLNMDAQLKRLFSSSTNLITSIQAGCPGFTVPGAPVANPNLFVTQSAVGVYPSLSSPLLLLKFLTSQPSDHLQSKNVVPYADFPRYLTTASQGSPIAAGATAPVITSNININQVPDLFIVVVRKPMSSQNYNDTSSFFKINSVSINFNNQSGLLSSASSSDLWRMSAKNGCNQPWTEWGGNVFVNTNKLTGAGGNIPTIGSMLVINPAYDLSLPDQLSSGSLGNFNVQFSINVTNQFGVAITPEICVICMNSGLMVTQNGVSSTFTGILTSEQVLSAKTTRPSLMSSAEVYRMVGGKMNQMMSTVMMKKRDRPVLEMVKKGLSKHLR